MKDFAGMLKQAQQMQSKMAEMQKQMEDLTVEGSSGAGMVKVVLSGKGDMKSVKIDPSLASPDELEIAEDLIIAAHTDAKAKLEKVMQERMKEVTGGISLPPGLGF